jgi:YcxB-like protein
MRPVIVTYSLTVDQFMVACNALWAHQAIGKNGNRMIAAVLAVATGMSVVWHAPYVAVFFGAATVLFGVADVLRNWLWRRHYSRLVKYTGPITTTFRPDAVTFRSAEGDYSQPWSVFGSFTETADHFFLHVGTGARGRQFSVIPKSALTAPADLSALQALLSASLQRRVRRWL